MSRTLWGLLKNRCCGAARCSNIGTIKNNNFYLMGKVNSLLVSVVVVVAVIAENYYDDRRRLRNPGKGIE